MGGAGLSLAPSRIEAIHVCHSLPDKHPPHGAPRRRAIGGLDFARIAALLNRTSFPSTTRRDTA
ncbi:hypothetical protein BH11PSE10_BH11PSE10_16130 [soil metagenome]